MTPLEKAMVILFGDKDYRTDHMGELFLVGEHEATPNAIIEIIKQLERLP